VSTIKNKSTSAAPQAYININIKTEAPSAAETSEGGPLLYIGINAQK
jgi:hypothetical protein